MDDGESASNAYTKQAHRSHDFDSVSAYDTTFRLTHEAGKKERKRQVLFPRNSNPHEPYAQFEGSAGANTAWQRLG